MAEKLGRVPWVRRNGRKVDVLLLRCDCGEELPCPDFTNTCDCGREYNSCGQLLAPREQWGWETGEHPADIGMITGEEDDWEASW